jgi:hypothetical protein
MFGARRNRRFATSASPNWNFATLREQRIGRARCQTGRNCFTRQRNPARSDDSSALAGLNHSNCGIFGCDQAAKSCEAAAIASIPPQRA